MAISSVKKLLQYTKENNCSIGEYMLMYEMEHQQCSKEEVLNKMLYNWQVMKESIETGINNPQISKGGLIGGQGKQLLDYCQEHEMLSGKNVAEAVSYALAVAEVNATMGKIVACPTAGSCGIVPGVFYKLQQLLELSDEEIVYGLLAASGIGMIIASKASVSGAVAGCQAECGAAAAMASAAAVELAGGTPAQAAEACALVLKNILGLVCDPVAGLVEVPCAKRNAMGVSLALSMADMARAGIKSVIPVDEVIDTMGSVGRSLPDTLRETALGGLAMTPTGQALRRKIFGR